MFIALAVAAVLEWLAGVTLLGATSVAVHMFLGLAAASLFMHFLRARRLRRLP
jgi:hypothetical protein